MEPADWARVALEGKIPEQVPTFELEFQLSEQLIGKTVIRGQIDANLTGTEREKLLITNAETLVEIAVKLDYSIITGIHWLPTLADQIFTLQYLKSKYGKKYLLATLVDGTFALPSGSEITGFVYRLHDERQQMLDYAKRTVEAEITRGIRLIEFGADLILMCSDYCFNDGPFLSPAMFAEFITPFLAEQVKAFKSVGAYTLKHTDGNIMPILDQLVDTGIDCLHSLDPMAKVSLSEVKKRYGHRLCLAGNVNCAIVQSGKVDDVIQDSERSLREGTPGGGYIFTTSNCIFTGVPLENYFAMLQVRRDWNQRYSLADKK